MTSPVERISGPRIGVDAGEAREGQHRFLHRDMVGFGRVQIEVGELLARHHRAAMPATGRPIALATKGTVRLARGLTSST